IDIIDLTEFAPGRPLTVVLRHADGTSDTILANHSYNAGQIEWFKAGSALNRMALQFELEKRATASVPKAKKSGSRRSRVSVKVAVKKKVKKSPGKAATKALAPRKSAAAKAVAKKSAAKTATVKKASAKKTVAKESAFMELYTNASDAKEKETYASTLKV